MDQDREPQLLDSGVLLHARRWLQEPLQWEAGIIVARGSWDPAGLCDGGEGHPGPFVGCGCDYDARRYRAVASTAKTTVIPIVHARATITRSAVGPPRTKARTALIVAVTG